jgi:predicted dehydrogenase
VTLHASDELRDLLLAIDAGSDPAMSFADGLQVQHALEAGARSARERSLVDVERTEVAV